MIQLTGEQRARVEAFLRKHHLGLLALVFTDLVGSTRLKQELGDVEGASLIDAEHAEVRELLKSFPEGEEIETAGDSFFLVFARPSDAVRFALSMHVRHRGLSRSAPRPILGRVGIHVGEVLISNREEESRGKDIFGIQVDTCARIMSLASGGQTLLSHFAFDNSRQVLRGQDLPGVGPLAWVSHGAYDLYGVEEPQEICEVGETGVAPLKQPTDSAKAHRHAGSGELVLGWRPACGEHVPGTHWLLEQKLGEGGFGEVWLARHERLKEQRVLKFCFRVERVRSLKRELTLLRVLKERVGVHPNIVCVHDVYLEQPPYYLATEYVPGKDLRAWWQEKLQAGAAPSLATRLEIVAQIADALEAAHGVGIIHRDVKPANIIVVEDVAAGPPPLSGERGGADGRGEVRAVPDSGKGGESRAVRELMSGGASKVTAKLTDFGIGQVVSNEVLADLTRLGFTATVISQGSSRTGIQMYMAPELVSGKPATVGSDIYALGVVL